MKQQINLITSAGIFEGRLAPFLPWAAPAGVLAVVLLLTVFTLRSVHEARTARADLAAARSRQEAIVQELQRVGRGEVTVQSTGRLEGRSFDRGTRWSPIGREISVIVPDGVWLTKIETQDNAGAKGIQASGVARSPERVTRLMAALELSPLFTAVALDHVRQKDGGVEFQMTFRLRGG